MAQILNPESSSQCFQQFAVLKRNLNIKVKCIQDEFNEKLIDFVNTHLFNYLDNVFEDFLSNNLSKFDHTHIQGEPIKLDSFTSERIDSSSLIVEADEDDIQKIDETQPHYETTASIAESTSCENTNVQRSTCSELRGPSLYKCETCEVSVSGLLELQAHYRSHPSRPQLKPLPGPKTDAVDDQPMYVCDICPKTLTTKTGLITHRRTHTRENWHDCDICNRSFAQKNALIVHLRTHSCAINAAEHLISRQHSRDICLSMMGSSHLSVLCAIGLSLRRQNLAFIC